MDPATPKAMAPKDLIKVHVDRKLALVAQRAEYEKAMASDEEVAAMKADLAKLDVQIANTEIDLNELRSSRKRVTNTIEIHERLFREKIAKVVSEIAACDSSIHYITVAVQGQVQGQKVVEDTSSIDDEANPAASEDDKPLRPYPTLDLLVAAMHRSSGAPLVHQVIARMLEVYPNWKTPDHLVAIDNSEIVKEIVKKLAPLYEKEKSARVTNTEGKHYDEKSYRNVLKFLVEANVVLTSKDSYSVLYKLDLTNEQTRDLIDSLYKDTLGDLLTARIVDSHQDLLMTCTSVDATVMGARDTGFYTAASRRTEVDDDEVERRRKVKRDRRAASKKSALVEDSE